MDSGNGRNGGMTPRMLRHTLRYSPGEKMMAPNSAVPSGTSQTPHAPNASEPPPSPEVPSETSPQQPAIDPVARVATLHQNSNDAFATAFVAQLMEFLENCLVTTGDAPAIVDNLTRGMSSEMKYVFDTHLVALLVEIKQALPEMMRRMLQEVGARMEQLTYEQQADVLFSILRETIMSGRE